MTPSGPLGWERAATLVKETVTDTADHLAAELQHGYRAEATGLRRLHANNGVGMGNGRENSWEEFDDPEYDNRSPATPENADGGGDGFDSNFGSGSGDEDRRLYGYNSKGEKLSFEEWQVPCRSFRPPWGIRRFDGEEECVYMLSFRPHDSPTNLSDNIWSRGPKGPSDLEWMQRADNLDDLRSNTSCFSHIALLDESGHISGFEAVPWGPNPTLSFADFSPEARFEKGNTVGSFAHGIVPDDYVSSPDYTDWDRVADRVWADPRNHTKIILDKATDESFNLEDNGPLVLASSYTAQTGGHVAVAHALQQEIGYEGRVYGFTGDVSRVYDENGFPYLAVKAPDGLQSVLKSSAGA